MLEAALVNTCFAEAIVAARCHYCECRVLRLGTPAAKQRPDLVGTRDHTEPKCDGGTKWVISCHQCNQIKGADPYDLFMTFMVHGGRTFHRHERKNKYRWYRAQVIAIGLAAFNEEVERMKAQVAAA